MNRRVVWGIAAILLIGAAVWPVTTRVGVDYRWSTKRITLLEKTIHFMSRDLQTRRLAAEVTHGASGAEETLLKIFTWTVQHVQPTPPGLPVVDDHVLHIIIRGYGAQDQRTEAFALLASYSGFPATKATARIPGTDKDLVVALVRDGPKTYVFDVNNNISLRNEQGTLADLTELLSNPGLMAQAADHALIEGVPYEHYLLGLRGLQATFARMEAQKPWPRLRQELDHLFGRHAD